MRSKKQLGMYTVTIDEDGSLNLQAPTLLRPVTLDAKQVKDLHIWLNSVDTEHAPAATTPATTQPAVIEPIAPTAPQTPVEPVVQTLNVSPEVFTQQTIQAAIAEARNQHPSSLAPEYRDRFIEHITRNPAIRPLMSKGQVSFKQVMLWVEQALGSGEK